MRVKMKKERELSVHTLYVINQHSQLCYNATCAFLKIMMLCKNHIIKTLGFMGIMAISNM